VGPGDHVLEIGAGLGSLTLPLAATGAHVRAVEFDRALIPALEETVSGRPNVIVRHADAMKLRWTDELAGVDRWVLCANLPYNIATPLVLDALAVAPAIERLVVMVQREVGERLAAEPGADAYGVPSVRVAFRATARVLRRVPAAVFWPRPNVASVVVRLDRLPHAPVTVDEARLWRVVDGGFGERRKTMRNALRRLGLGRDAADEVLAASGVPPDARAEQLGLAAFAAIAERMPA
jgi:16S rRNA (adenine1518-N6/adenine1519-N6)-dimethyltransferase